MRNFRNVIGRNLLCFMIFFVGLSIYYYGNVLPMKISPREHLVVEYSDGEIELKDTEMENGDGQRHYLSKTIDPFIILNNKISDNVIFVDMLVDNIKRNGVVTGKQKGQIYGLKDGIVDADGVKYFELRRGRNVVKFNNISKYDQIRIDYVSDSQIDVIFKKISITNYFEAIWFLPIIVRTVALLVVVNFILLFQTGAFFDMVKRVGTRVDDIFRQFVKFVVKYKVAVIIIIAIAIACYGVLISYYTIYIDEERQLIEDYEEVAWIAQGRFINYFIERFLLVGKKYTPHLNDFLAVCLLTLSAIFHCSNLDKIKSIDSNWPIVFWGAYSLCMPFVNGAFMLVGIYNFEMALGQLILAFVMAILISDYYSIWTYVICIFLLTLAIGIYQAFVPLYITLVIVYYIYIKLSKDKEKYKKIVKVSVISLLLSLIVYYIADKVILNCYNIPKSSYLSSNFIGWNNGCDFTEIVRGIMVSIGGIYLGRYKYMMAGELMPISLVLMCIYVIYILDCTKFERVEYTGLFILLLLAPFSLMAATGSNFIAGRTMLGIPYVIAFIWFISWGGIQKLPIARVTVGVIGVLLIFNQIQYLNQFFLADYNRYQQDKIIASEIMADIREVNSGNMDVNVVFHGRYSHDDNNMTTYYENAGSFFSVDGGSNLRITRFMQAIGYDINIATDISEDRVKSCIEGKPNWPEKGSVIKIDDGYTIIKLSD